MALGFFEGWRCAGVDHAAQPLPGMVVPAGGSNLVVLDSSGMDLHVASNNSGIQLKKIDDSATRQKLIELNNVLMQPGEDAQRREAFLPTPLFYYHARVVYEISSKNPTGFPGALVQATLKGKPKATLRVAVLKPMTFKVAIRKGADPDQDGTMVEQSKKPFDIKDEFINMNAVWTAQTNISFELVPSEPLKVDIRDKATREELGKAYRLKDPNTAEFPREVNPDKLKDFFSRRKIGDAHMTFFIVDKIVRNSRKIVNGTMFADDRRGLDRGEPARPDDAAARGRPLPRRHPR
jgi:hypothetical protein